MRRTLLALALLLLAVPGGLPAADPPAREYQVKAAFVFNFAQFTEWPVEAFATPEAPLRIGVLGSDPFGPLLEETVRGATVRGRAIEIRRGERADQLRDCQVVFVSRSETDRLTEVLAALDQGPALTISDIAGFAGRGGMIDFYLEGRKVRFAIDPAAAQRRQLKLSAQLLRLGRIIGEGQKSDIPKGGG